MAGPAMAGCQSDLSGANDVPGQKDLTRLCVDEGTGAFDLAIAWNWDEISMNGGNTADGCSLYDTDNDGNVNYAICVQWSTTRIMDTMSVYSCPDDNRPYNCGGATLIAGTLSSTCSVTLSNTDPFTTGENSPSDTQAVCNVDLADFNSAAAARLIDVCSYPSASPTSSASDCIYTTACSSNSDCDDENSCTTDTCDTTIGNFCRHSANTGSACGSSSITECDAADTCDLQGFCNDDIDPSGTECRAALGDCDIAEFCDGTNKTCPDDGFQPADTACGSTQIPSVQIRIPVTVP